MLKALEERGSWCANDTRTQWCLVCNSKWRIDEKWFWLFRWSWTPRTWINRAVIFLSMLNVVFAHYSSEVVDDGRGVSDESGHYTRQWAVHIEGGQQVADKIAAKHDFVNLGKASFL